MSTRGWYGENRKDIETAITRFQAAANDPDRDPSQREHDRSVLVSLHSDLKSLPPD